MLVGSGSIKKENGDESAQCDDQKYESQVPISCPENIIIQDIKFYFEFTLNRFRKKEILYISGKHKTYSIPVKNLIFYALI